jgi:mono/diheme cytochrome c family protein
MRLVVYAVVFASFAAIGCERKIAGGRSDGAAVFKEACSRCHGEQGVPDRGQVVRLGVKNLTEPELHTRLSDADIANQIREGSKNQNMPSFAGVLEDAQIDAVITHVRTLRRDGGPPTPQ